MRASERGEFHSIVFGFWQRRRIPFVHLAALDPYGRTCAPPCHSAALNSDAQTQINALYYIHFHLPSSPTHKMAMYAVFRIFELSGIVFINPALSV